MKTIGMIVGLLLWAAPVLAQTQEVTVGVPFRVVASYPTDANTTGLGFRIYVDNARLGPDHPASGVLVNGVITIPVTVTTRGAHVIEMTAFNPDRESARSVAIPFAALLPPPVTPTEPRIVLISATQAENGGITLQLGIEQVPIVPAP